MYPDLSIAVSIQCALCGEKAGAFVPSCLDAGLRRLESQGWVLRAGHAACADCASPLVAALERSIAEVRLARRAGQPALLRLVPRPSGRR